MMSTAALARTMVPPQHLRQFQQDFDTASTGAETACRFLAAARRRAREAEIMRATRMAALDVGRALLRMHASGSYLDRFNNWTALCQAVRIDRRESYSLMKLAKVTSNLQEAGISADGLTRTQARVLASLDPADQADVMRQARADGDTSAAALEYLRRQLRAPIEAEARRHRPGGRTDPLGRIRRGIAHLQQQTAKLSTAQRCGELLRALEAAVNDAEPAGTDAA